MFIYLQGGRKYVQVIQEVVPLHFLKQLHLQFALCSPHLCIPFPFTTKHIVSNYKYSYHCP